ncbi:hypothetical protein V8B97DRAFT_1485284 [Scleroderma yunnanense]
MDCLPQTLSLYTHSLQGPLVGSFFSMLFYGISCVQTFFYYQTYPDDNKLLKNLVAIIWTIESVYTGLMISFNSSYVINGFSGLVGLNQIIWDLLVTVETGFVVIFIVNLFFTWRVWAFSKKHWAVCLLRLLVIAYIISIFHCSWYLFNTYSYSNGFSFNIVGLILFHHLYTDHAYVNYI